ncbi:ribosomal protein L5 [Gonapodya prolifera JEL478]|uniref:Ribosomal protein L5 n=1 Tax=Gonapodya prolifera (strain JEL478) TaxID=1344416 RepID=A0A139ASY9_GONPJ|nr:ribosomal protein L5 [Gonapodya prolifera JEL478]|eukprot:KXS19852.1 ribosomal protein L5 [Gonapodya prolifera JEL478]
MLPSLAPVRRAVSALPSCAAVGSGLRRCLSSSSPVFADTITEQPNRKANPLDATPNASLFPIPEDQTPISARSRYHSHYMSVLAQDMLYLTYQHQPEAAPFPEKSLPEHLLTAIFSEPLPKGPKPPPRLLPAHFQNPIDYTSSRRTRAHHHSPPKPAPYDPSKLPELDSITVRCTPPTSHQNKHLILLAMMQLRCISGVRPEPTFATWSDAESRLRKGQAVGAEVFLKGELMYSFLERCVECVLPRLREWEGWPAQGDGFSPGSVTVTLPSQAVGLFPDIEPYFDQFPRLYDIQIQFRTSARTPEEAVLLLSGFQIPFKDPAELPKAQGGKKESGEEDRFAQFKKKKRRRGMSDTAALLKGGKAGLYEALRIPRPK